MSALKNWKTTVAGLVAAAGLVMPMIADALQNGAPIHWGTILAAFAMAALGVKAKDASGNVQANQ
jgi:uncharacterized membrane protein YjjB (DUF3815 family)